MRKVVGNAEAVFHKPSPGWMRWMFSTMRTSRASGTRAGSCATSAAT